MLEVLDTISDPGHPLKLNEDAFGHGPRHAWVIDGATGVAEGELLDAPTDAHWLARAASDFFAEHARTHGADLAALTRRAIEDLASRFEAERTRPPVGRHELPSAAMTLVHSDGKYLHCVNFADCRLILQDEDGGVTVLGDNHLDREAASRRRTAELVRRIAPGSDMRSSPEVMAHPRAARARQNTDDGYWILGLDPRAVDFMRSWTVPLKGAVTGLLMSDGFASLAYDYGRMTPAELAAEAHEKGLAAIVEAIRKIEREEDPDMRAYPRFKRSDDATALLFRVDPARA